MGECGETAQNQAIVYRQGQIVLTYRSSSLHPAMQVLIEFVLAGITIVLSFEETWESIGCSESEPDGMHMAVILIINKTQLEEGSPV